MSIPDKQSGGVPPSSTPNAAPNTNPMPAMSPFAAHFQEQRERKKNMLMRHIDRISLSSKLVACTIAVLLIGVSVISFSIRALVNNYMLQKTDTQLSSQSQLVVNNIDLLSKNDSSGPNSYFLQIQYTDGTKDKEGNPLVVTPLMPQMQDGIVSVPILPTYGDTNGITLGQAFTTQAVAKQIITVQSDSADSQNDPANGNSNSSDTITKVLANPTANANHAAIVTARAPWRILPVTFQQNGKDRAVVYIGLSLADQIDTVNTLTRYCIVVGIAVVLLGGSLSTLIIQHTMTPLKRIEKTAAKIAAGDLSQRIPSAPENTEVGSLAASLNSMLTRIESSFHEQEETTDKMKRFVSDASHELRTPIAVIQGYANLLNRWGKDDPATRQEAIDAIRQEADSMKELVEQLLFLARGDNDSMHIEMETFDLTEVAAEVLKETGMIDQTHTFSARWEGAVPVCADVGLTKQALRILVDNSIKYTPAGGHITLSAALRDGMARLSVQDEGQGIDAGSLPHVFDRFYRTDQSRARQTGGTGLGLAIAKWIVDRHGGWFEVRSWPGVGTRMTIVLPVAELDAGGADEDAEQTRPA